MAGIKNENNGKGSRIMETGNGIIVWPIRVQYLCLTNDYLDQSKISNGIVPREIGWAGIKWTFYRAGIKKMRMMIQEVELWKQEIELLSDQSDISNVVILNHKAKLVSFSTTVHKATHSSCPSLN